MGAGAAAGTTHRQPRAPDGQRHAPFRVYHGDGVNTDPPPPRPKVFSQYIQIKSLCAWKGTRRLFDGRVVRGGRGTAGNWLGVFGKISRKELRSQAPQAEPGRAR